MEGIGATMTECSQIEVVKNIEELHEAYAAGSSTATNDIEVTVLAEYRRFLDSDFVVGEVFKCQDPTLSFDTSDKLKTKRATVESSRAFVTYPFECTGEEWLNEKTFTSGAESIALEVGGSSEWISEEDIGIIATILGEVPINGNPMLGDSDSRSQSALEGDCAELLQGDGQAGKCTWYPDRQRSNSIGAVVYTPPAECLEVLSFF
jgi:hypothetical protein